MSRVYTVLLVIAGILLTGFIMILTGNFVIQTEPAPDSSSKSIKDDRQIVYVLPDTVTETKELTPDQFARE